MNQVEKHKGLKFCDKNRKKQNMKIDIWNVRILLVQGKMKELAKGISKTKTTYTCFTEN